MMRFQAGRCVAALAPLFLLAACAGEPSATQMLNSRMSARLAPEIEAGQIAVAPLPAGSQIAISDETLFAPGSGKLDDRGQRTLTYLIQALLEPSILTIQVNDASDSLSGARAAAVMDYFTYHRLGAQVLPSTDAPGTVPVGPVGTPVQGTTITVSVVPG